MNKKQNNWSGANNPYISLPKLVMHYEPNESGDSTKRRMNEFDLNEFFRAEYVDDNAEFIYKRSSKWLSLIVVNIFKVVLVQIQVLKASHALRRFRHGYLNHTLWFLPDVKFNNEKFTI